MATAHPLDEPVRDYAYSQRRNKKSDFGKEGGYGAFGLVVAFLLFMMGLWPIGLVIAAISLLAAHPVIRKVRHHLLFRDMRFTLFRDGFARIDAVGQADVFAWTDVHGISAVGGESVPWKQMKRMEIGEGVVQLRRDGQFKAWARVPVYEIPNLNVFLNLAEKLRTRARSLGSLYRTDPERPLDAVGAVELRGDLGGTKVLAAGARSR